MKIRQLRTASETFDIPFAAGKEFDVVGFGLNAVDYVSVVPSYPKFDTKTEIIHHERLSGGQVATAICCIARMGLKGKYIGKLGSDDDGRFCLRSLQSENIDLRSVIVEPGARNQVSFIIIDQTNGERTILWQRDPRLNFRKSELRKDAICSGRVLHIDGHDDAAAIQAAEWAAEEGIPVVIDLDKIVPQMERLLPKIDFLITSADFASRFAGRENPMEAMRGLRKYCQGFIAVTLGARGAMALIGEECVTFPAFEVKAVDTTGAGDVFHGGFIYGLLQNWPLDRIMTFANAAAALDCTRLGARAGIPTLPEVLTLVDGRIPL